MSDHEDILKRLRILVEMMPHCEDRIAIVDAANHIAALRKDAGRYVKLRQAILSQKMGAVMFGQFMNWHPDTFRDGFDAAIDAAIDADMMDAP